MIDITKKIRVRNIDVKYFKITPQELEIYGINIPVNLKNYKCFSLKEFVITDDHKFKYVRLRDKNQKVRLFISSIFAGSLLRWDRWAQYMSRLVTQEELKKGITITQLEEKNKKYLNRQLRYMSKKVSHEQQNDCLLNRGNDERF